MRHWRRHSIDRPAATGRIKQLRRPAPSMFAAGDLPVFTASGVDVDVLRFVPWTDRHSVATTANRAEVFQMVQDADRLARDTLQTGPASKRSSTTDKPPC
jgi:hypothetical protein